MKRVLPVSYSSLKESRQTSQQLQEIVREHCDNMFDDVSKVYSNAELGTDMACLDDHIPEHRHFEPDSSQPDPFPPPEPGNDEPLKAYEAVAMPPGLAGVLGAGRGIVNELISTLNIEPKTEQLEELYQWFEGYTALAENSDASWEELENALDEADMEAEKSMEQVMSAEEEFGAKKAKAKEILDAVKEVLGSKSNNGVSAKAEKRLEQARGMARGKTQALEQAVKVCEAEAQDLAELKKEVFSEQLLETRREQDRVKELTNLQREVEQRKTEIEYLESRVQTQGNYFAKLQKLVDVTQHKLRSNQIIESPDVDMETLIRNSREELTKKPRFVRQQCPEITEAEEKEKECHHAALTWDLLANDINAQASSKEDLLELVSNESFNKATAAAPKKYGKENSNDRERPIEVEELKAQLGACFSALRQERGKIDQLHKMKKAILHTTQRCEDLQKELRRELNDSVSRVLVEGAEEEEQLLQNKEDITSLLPSSWRKSLESSWEQKQQDSEIYALLVLAKRRKKFRSVEQRTKPASLTHLATSLGLMSKDDNSIKIVLADAEATWLWQESLEQKLTPVGKKMQEMDKLAEVCLQDDLDCFWSDQAETENKRMAELRSVRHELHKEAKQISEKLPPEQRLQQVIQLVNTTEKAQTRAAEAFKMRTQTSPRLANASRAATRTFSKKTGL